MLKTGIYCQDHLSIDTIRSFWGKRKYVAITLYPKVAASEGPDRDRLLEHILCRFATANGSYKRTQSHRFEVFDNQVVQVLQDQQSTEGGWRVHDMAVSDGRTAVDFFMKLAGAIDTRLEFIATDAFSELTAISNSSNSLVLVIDSISKALVQVIRPPFVFNIEKHESSYIYPINRLMLGITLRTSVKRVLDQYHAGDPGIRSEQIQLLSPECIRLIKMDSRFKFGKYSILEPQSGKYNLIRAMNVLNRSYFSDTDIRKCVLNIKDGLLRDGLFVVGSNQDAGSTVDGAVYQWIGSRFKELRVSGQGAAIKGIMPELGI
jgi:chemotaxis methyl-accepting protein methylase